uniref:Phosphatidate cytidylyltransferase, mitochondrial n=1 Tax=Neospora caninum (strain Liverpool) TaxID=572307 RepID=A0A0F7UM56_NEOCL|nr:TPA: MMP37 like protein, putative [Neospora caninum Liverpool]
MSHLHKPSGQPDFPWHAFPPHVEWAIAYGSSFFSQSPNCLQSDTDNEQSGCSPRSVPSPSKKCVLSTVPLHSSSASPASSSQNSSSSLRDYLLLVPAHAVRAFHEENLRIHPQHYSWIFRLYGAETIECYQRLGHGVEVFYNTLVRLPHDGQLAKYGVAAIEDLQAELTDWTSLFFSGRLHKPVHFFSPKGTSVTKAPFWKHLQANRLNALRVALLLQKKAVVPFRDVLYAICGLSYTGDIRMAFVENPRKLSNLVAGQTIQLFSLYYPLLSHIPGLRLVTQTSHEQRAAACRRWHPDGPNAVSCGLPTDLLASVRDKQDESGELSNGDESSALVRDLGSAERGALRTQLEGADDIGYREDATADLCQEILTGRMLVEADGCLSDPSRFDVFRLSLFGSLPPPLRQRLQSANEDKFGCVFRTGFEIPFKRREARSTFHAPKNSTTICCDADTRGSFPLKHTQHAIPKSSVPHIPSFARGDGLGRRPIPDCLTQLPSADGISRALARIVRRSSTISAFKNAVSAGLPRTILYGVQKVAKRWKR